MPDVTAPGHGWNEYQKLVMSELERLDRSIKGNSKGNDDAHDKITKQLQEIRIDITKLQMKAGVWGLMGGLIPTISVILFWIAKGGTG